MSVGVRLRYRSAVLWAGAYLALFLLVASCRLALMGPGDGLPRIPAPALVQLIAVYVAGGVFALPLIWIRRRLAREPDRPSRWPVVVWLLVSPASALGVVVGGLLGPVGILLYGGLPVLIALGGGLALSAFRHRSGSGEAIHPGTRERERETRPRRREPASGFEPPTC